EAPPLPGKKVGDDSKVKGAGSPAASTVNAPLSAGMPSMPAPAAGARSVAESQVSSRNRQAGATVASSSDTEQAVGDQGRLQESAASGGEVRVYDCVIRMEQRPSSQQNAVAPIRPKE
ncbi:MAG: hypothetical protein FWD61_07225, partial [Phycisphaerales bacterium]|nr:hypothetical protein [Phycisphaerales bacterium]